jgi:hypothetical protein
MKLFKKNYRYQKLDSNLTLISANNEVLFYKLSTIVLTIVVLINIFNVAETKTVLRHVLEKDTLEHVVLIRNSNLTRIEFPRNQNIPTALNNPGAVRPGNSEADKYAIGVVDTKTGPFLAFMNPEQGFNALKAVLKGYRNTTIKDMIYRYAPPVENNTDDYINNICESLKCKPNTLVKNINQDKLCKVISKIEGYKR